MSENTIAYVRTSREHEVAAAQAKQQAADAAQAMIDQTTQAQALGYAAAVFCRAFLQGLTDAEVSLTDEERIQVLCAALGRL